MHLKYARVSMAALLLVSACTMARTGSPRHQRTDYLNGAKSELNQIDQHINDLKAKADRAQGSAKAELNAEIDQLRRKEAAARQRVAQIEAATEDSWSSLQAGADAALNDLKNAYDQAAARFK